MGTVLILLAIIGCCYFVYLQWKKSDTNDSGAPGQSGISNSVGVNSAQNGSIFDIHGLENK